MSCYASGSVGYLDKGLKTDGLSMTEREELRHLRLPRSRPFDGAGLPDKKNRSLLRQGQRDRIRRGRSPSSRRRGPTPRTNCVVRTRP